jgi:hypothetical protein
MCICIMGLNWHIGVFVCLLHCDHNIFCVWTKRKCQQFKLCLTYISIQWNFQSVTSLLSLLGGFVFYMFVVYIFVFHVFPTKVWEMVGVLLLIHQQCGLSSQQHLEVCTQIEARNQHVGNGCKIYRIMMKENCKLDHQVALSNFKTHFAVS